MNQIELNQRTRDLPDRVRHSSAHGRTRARRYARRHPGCHAQAFGGMKSVVGHEREAMSREQGSVS